MAEDDLEVCKNKVEANPEVAELRLDYGTALAAAGRLQEAAEQFEEAIRLDPEKAMAHYNLGTLYGKLLLKDLAEDQMWEDHTDEDALFEKASSCFKEAIRLEPNMTAALNNLARLQAAMGLKDEAREHFEKSLAIDSAQEDVSEDLAELDDEGA